ncbi:hypothetical protein ACU6TU_03215 [Halomonas sp. LS-001]
MSPNSAISMLDLPSDVHAADVYVYGDEWGPWLEAGFYLPGQQRERVIEQVEQVSVEDF